MQMLDNDVLGCESWKHDMEVSLQGIPEYVYSKLITRSTIVAASAKKVAEEEAAAKKAEEEAAAKVKENEKKQQEYRWVCSVH